MSDGLVTSVDGAVATVVFDRPERLNAMTQEVQLAYCQELQRLDADPDVRVIVTTGAGRGFCAGADLQGGGDFAGAVKESLDQAGRLPLDAPLHLHTPHIAAINGPSAGMGTAYALMADIRFAAQSARIGTTFSRLGLPGEWAIAHTLSHTVGHAAATELLLSGRYVDADEALSLGLVSRVWPDAVFRDEVAAYARDLAEHTSPASHATLKRQLRDVADGQSVDDAFHDALENLLRHLDLPDITAAVKAFQDKTSVSFPPYVGS